MNESELPVINKTFELVKWFCEILVRFPRTHRYALGATIERRLYDLLEGLIEAKYTKSREALLREANLRLEVLRFLVRLAHDLDCVQLNSYEHAVREINEIGAMVGGWLRQQNRGENSGGRRVPE